MAASTTLKTAVEEMLATEIAATSSEPLLPLNWSVKAGSIVFSSVEGGGIEVLTGRDS